MTLLVCSILATGQNLVPNPSFEQYDTCPTDQNQIHFATGWSNYWSTSPNSSPDYFNSCSTTFWTSVPSHFGDYQQPASGNAYAGIYTYETPQASPDNILREFVGAQLLSPLVIGTKYYLSFKTNLALDTNHIFNQATNNIGILFSTIPHNYYNPTSITNFAHLNSISVITDTLNWTIVSGSFIADSAYEYAIIGNFFDDIHTTILQIQDTLSDKSAYYYIDDVYVSTDSLAGGIAEQNIQGKIKVYPNPFSFSTTLNIDIVLINATLTVYNSYGKTVKRIKNISGQTINLQRDNLSSGLYFLQLTQDNKILTTDKIIITDK